jgi:hypothetical protein
MRDEPSQPVERPTVLRKVKNAPHPLGPRRERRRRARHMRRLRMAVSRIDVVAPLIGKHRTPAYPAYKRGLITGRQARMLGVSQGLINRGRHG